MNTHADKTQENKSQSVANEVSQKQSVGESTFQFVDNRPEAIAQRKLQEMANNSPQVKQSRAFQEMANTKTLGNQFMPTQPGEFTIQRMMRRGPSLRASTRGASMPYADPRSRTRGATNVRAVRAGANLPPQRRNLATHPFRSAEDDTPLWNGTSRPSWGDVEETFYGDQTSQDGTKKDGTARLEYECVISAEGGTAFLPRRGDADEGEDTAPIGHVKQWRDYIVEKAQTERWTVEGGDVEGGEILAISLAEAESWYRDTDNLQLQGQIYNSSVATAYASDPPSQDWVD